MTHISDEQLKRALDGDQASLNELLIRVGGEVRRTLSIAEKWRSVLDGDDVMQVTYMEAILRIHSFSGDSIDAFRAWIRRIAQNNLRDAVKGLERDKRPPPGKRIEPAANDKSYVALYDMIGTASGTPSKVAAAGEIRTCIEAAMKKLPPDYATVIRLFDLEGRSGPEVGRAMNRSRGAAFMLLARAREQLRELLGRESQFFSHGP